MNQKSKTELNYESIVNGRPLSEQGIDIHVYVVPLRLWRDHLRSADSQTVITEAISAGFVRVMPDAIVNSLRIDVENQLGFETVPRNFVFLRCVGRCFTVIKAKQEYSIKAKNFTPPETFAPEIFLMELTADIRSILTSSQSNQSNLKDGRRHQKRISHMTTPHHKPNKSEGVLHVPPHLNDSRLTGSLSEEEEEVDEQDEKDKDEDRRPSQVKRQLTVTKTSAAATGDYILTPNSKFTQTMEENNAEEEDAENRTRLKRKEDEERRREMLRKLALEQQREEQRKSEEMARKEAEAKREEELRKKQEEELRKRPGEEDRSRLEEEERKWLEEVNRRELEKRRKQEEELRKKLEEEQRRGKEEEMRRKQEEEEELRKRQEDELKKKLEEQQKRMTNEELRRKLEEELRRKQDEERRRNQEEELKRQQDEERRNQEEELQRKQDEELRRTQEEELRRKQDEDKRRNQGEELRRKQDEERRRKQEEDQRRKQDELNRKKEEEERKKMTAEQQKAADKAALLKEIERLREDRKMQELRKDELTKKVRSLQDRSQLNQNNARDSWRKRYLDEKKKTPALNSDCSQLKKDLNAINKKILSHVESTSHVINHGTNQKPSEKSNLKIQAIRLRMEIEDLKSRLDNMNMKLTAELKLRTQAEDELQLLRRNQFARKKGKPLSVVQVKQTPTPAGKGVGGGGGTGGGKAVGSQRGLHSMQQLPPVA